MGAFTVGCKMANHVDRSKTVKLVRLLVNTGSEYTWITGSILEKIGVEREKKDLAFQKANGTTISRSVDSAILYGNDTFTVDEVVFAEKGDLLLLGARTSKSLDLSVDPRAKKLTAAGPLPAASFVMTHLPIIDITRNKQTGYLV